VSWLLPFILGVMSAPFIFIGGFIIIDTLASSIEEKKLRRRLIKSSFLYILKRLGLVNDKGL